MKLDLSAIKARHAATTQGTWATNSEPGSQDVTICTRGYVVAQLGDEVEQEDTEFLAAAHQDIPTLVAEVERLRAALYEASNIALALFDRCGAGNCGQIALWLCWDTAGDHVYRCDAHKIMNGGMVGDDQPHALPAASNVERVRAWLSDAEKASGS